MLEPKTCKYILTIESSSLCDLINGPVDEYGMFEIEPLNDSSNLKISNPPFQTQAIDKTEDSSKENIRKDIIPPVEQETEVSDDKKKIVKIEL